MRGGARSPRRATRRPPPVGPEHDGSRSVGGPRGGRRPLRERELDLRLGPGHRVLAHPGRILPARRDRVGAARGLVPVGAAPRGHERGAGDRTTPPPSTATPRPPPPAAPAGPRAAPPRRSGAAGPRAPTPGRGAWPGRWRSPRRTLGRGPPGCARPGRARRRGPLPRRRWRAPPTFWRRRPGGRGRARRCPCAGGPRRGPARWAAPACGARPPGHGPGRSPGSRSATTPPQRRPEAGSRAAAERAGLRPRGGRARRLLGPSRQRGPSVRRSGTAIVPLLVRCCGLPWEARACAIS